MAVDDKSPSDLQQKLEESINEREELHQQYQTMENDLVTAKMAWAQLDLENDELTVNMKKAKQQLRVFSSKVTQLEIELVSSRSVGTEGSAQEEKQ